MIGFCRNWIGQFEKRPARVGDLIKCTQHSGLGLDCDFTLGQSYKVVATNLSSEKTLKALMDSPKGVYLFDRPRSMYRVIIENDRGLYIPVSIWCKEMKEMGFLGKKLKNFTYFELVK